MKAEDMRPFVRYCHAFAVEKQTTLAEAVCLDRRMMLVRQGRGRIQANGRIYEAGPGDLYLWPAGTIYQIAGPMEMIGVNFDLYDRKGRPETPVGPVRAELYHPDDRIEAEAVEDLPVLNEVLMIPQAEFCQQALEQMLEEYTGRRIFFRQSLQGRMQDLLVRILRWHTLRETSGLQDRLIQYLQAHYNEPMTNGQLGVIFHFHPSTLNRVMRLHTGMSLHRYLLEYRISQAVNLLETTFLPVEEIARRVGFSDANYFARYFRRIMGTSPSGFATAARDPKRGPLKR